MKSVLSPSQILDQTSDIGLTKAKSGTLKLLILSIIAGAFIALAAQGSMFASFNLMNNPDTLGLAKVIMGITFTPGIICVVLAGAELFTGNSLMIVAFLDKKITISELLRSWIIVYIGNLIGSILIAFLIINSGQLSSGNMDLAARTIITANTKVNLGFSKAFILGILCNWLVSVGVWMSYGSDSQVGKMLSVFFPIMLFVISGFEHSVANMYYIPAGIFAKLVPDYAIASGLSQEVLNGINWVSFFVNNLIPVTLGNIVGGGFFVGASYWLAFRRK